MGWLKDAFDIVREASSILSRPARAIRKIPVVDEIVDRLQHRYFNPIVIRQITNPRSPDLQAAFDLYENRIPESQRFEAADIARWLLEDRENRGNSNRPRDCFLVAKYKGRVCGFSLFHYYPVRRLVFFAYLVVAQKPGTPVGISDRLADRIAGILRHKRPFKHCKTIVLEVEDPRVQNDRAKHTRSIARIRRFCRIAEINGFTMRAVEVPYRQPPLSHTEHGENGISAPDAGGQGSARPDQQKGIDRTAGIHLLRSLPGRLFRRCRRKCTI